jgi:adenosylcobinamide-phosphate synthase
MSFFAVLFALIIEQVRPLGRGNWMHVGFRKWARLAQRSCDAGQQKHGWIAWTVAVAAPCMLATAVHVALWNVSVLLAFAWSVLVLYVTLGFRQFSFHFTDIRDALDDGDEDAARKLLAHWRQVDEGELPRSEIVRHVVEYSVLAAHRHVFGVLAWFVLLAAFGLGPAGAVLYRMSEFVARYWVHISKAPAAVGEGASAALQQASQKAWGLIDYLPARITALGFAVVGSFEEAIDAWRTYTQSFAVNAPEASSSRNDGLILAATSGAVNVRLGDGPKLDPTATGPFQAPPGRTPEAAHLRSVVGLVWRSVVLWMVLLALLTLARLIG